MEKKIITPPLNQFFVLLQVVGAEFTRTHLQQYLAHPVDLEVDCSTSRKKFDVKMRMAATTNNAIVCGGWDAIVKRYKLEEDEIVLFDFYVKNHGGLTVTLLKLGKYDGDE